MLDAGGSANRRSTDLHGVKSSERDGQENPPIA